MSKCLPWKRSIDFRHKSEWWRCSSPPQYRWKADKTDWKKERKKTTHHMRRLERKFWLICSRIFSLALLSVTNKKYCQLFKIAVCMNIEVCPYTWRVLTWCLNFVLRIRQVVAAGGNGHLFCQVLKLLQVTQYLTNNEQNRDKELLRRHKKYIDVHLLAHLNWTHFCMNAQLHLL